ncbi:MAG: hypothetical protein SPJ87_07560 [Oscillospiraceae bacterium]|nr:hypothetical protein [Oscillospiraceae bacterium]
MMALGDILAARADNARARGTVEAGTLGTVTVEALPVRELERLMRGADGDRAVFYAACRELQGAGAALLRAGKVYRPDQVMALVSDAEAAKAAEAVRALSGWTGMDGGTAQRTDFPAENADSAGAGEAADTGASAVTSDGRTADNGRSRGQRFDYTADGTDEGAGGQDSHETEIRPAVVQVNAEVRREDVQKKTADAAFRPDTVRGKAGKNTEIRHRSVHGEKAGGQASCEFFAEYGEPLPPDGKTQVLPEKSPDAPQNVGVSDKMDGSLQKTEREFLSERAAPEDGYALGLHESKSEIDGRGGANLHESESENGAGSGNALHEGESEIMETLHETESENDAAGGDPLHESKSEVTETLHETTSELAERVARELLDGLRRAAWVR